MNEIQNFINLKPSKDPRNGKLFPQDNSDKLSIKDSRSTDDGIKKKKRLLNATY